MDRRGETVRKRSNLYFSMRPLSLDRTGLCSASGVDAFALTDSNSALGNNGPFAAEQSRGTKSPYWRANDALGHVKESHQI